MTAPGIEPVLSLELRRVCYGGVVALRDVSLSLHRGEIVGVTGPVGAGKTTLALAAADLLPRAIPARVEGLVRHRAAGEPPAAYVFANPWTQLTELGGTVEEEVAVGPENQGLPSAVVRARVGEALDAVGAAHLARRVPYELSGGELQRVALASALALDAPLLVLDEPTSQLDPEATAELVERLRAAAARGKTVLVVEQNRDVLAGMASRVLVLADGSPVALGAPAEVPPERELRARPVTRQAAAAAGRRVLDVEEVSVAYDGREVLRRLDTSVRDGEVVAWTGRNGAGKSTLARAVMGLVATRGGRIRVDDVVLDPLPIEARARHVGLVFQDPGHQLFARSVLDEALFAPRALGIDRVEARTRALEALDSVGLAGDLQRHPADLTPQAQRRLAIAAALASRPRMLILDEPTAGQDADGRAHIARALELQRSRGGAAVITHDRAFARGACDRFVTIAGGQASSDVGGAPPPVITTASRGS